MGRNPKNHCIQEISIPTVFFIKSTARRLGAIDVMNRELVRQVAAKAVHMRYDPILRAVSPGSDPYNPGMFRIMGNIVPPLRAVLDGVKGASAKSANVMAYPNPSVCLPSFFTRKRAIRLPNPVLAYPRANIKAPKINQTVALPNPERAHLMDSFDRLNVGSKMCAGVYTNLNVAAKVTPITPIAAEGIGSNINPKITETNSAK